MEQDRIRTPGVTYNSWLPMSVTDPTAVQQSLQTCSINLQELCDADSHRLAKTYLKAWRHTAPPHCRVPVGTGGGVQSSTEDDPIHADRLCVPLE